MVAVSVQMSVAAQEEARLGVLFRIQADDLRAVSAHQREKSNIVLLFHGMVERHIPFRFDTFRMDAMRVILNVYGQRCRRPRGEISAMMRDTTWMDAGAALRDGFIDGIVDMGSGAVNTAPCHETNLAEAKAKVAAWLERTRPLQMRKSPEAQPAATVKETPIAETQQVAEQEQADKAPAAHAPGVPAAQLRRRLELITPNKR